MLGMHMLIAPFVLLAALVGLSDTELSAALRGEVPVHTELFTSPQGKSSGRGVGAIVIERPLSAVWATVSHYEDKAEYTPRLQRVSVLDKQEGLLHVYMEVDASVTTARYTAWFKLDETEHSIKWTLDHTAKSNTIADTQGEYRLYELGSDRTLAVYKTWVDSGLAVPRFIQDYMARKSLPNLLKALKRRVESGGQWRKP